jgi:glutamate racemase
LVGTKATIASKAYETELKKLDPKIELFSEACPLLVPLIEEGWHKKPEAKSILKKYLRSIKTHNIDTLILGCTHYPLMAKEFKKFMGKKVNVLEGGEIVAEKLKEYLERHSEIKSKLSTAGGVEYETTDDPEKMQDFIEKNFGMKIKMPKKVVIKS